ncbi:MAG: malate synthase A [Alphaproteobacteria bacterium]|jgi:malate synthase|nr:malate synthase A [Alphaproteobacteria bacterium]MDP6516701.1 malate synthase A [Alphaproteobacteria bacterium]
MAADSAVTSDQIQVTGTLAPGYGEILSEPALAFVADLHRRFEGRRRELIAARAELQTRLDAGETLDFPPETADVRAGNWKIAPVPADLQDRRVEITGPVDRKMVINAFNCGAKMFMACFEDASSPTWANLIDGQINMRDAVAGTIALDDPKSGKHYEIGADPAVLIVRPRGWHLLEKHLLVDGAPVAGALFDFALFFFHNAKALLDKGSGPYFYLPKLEHYLEARLWNDVFVHAQAVLGIPEGSIKTTVLIETLPSCFHAEEIIYELRDHMAGLNCGRWDYIFSYIKKNRTNPDAVLPDRAAVTMTVPFMRAYCLHVIKVCHRRGAHAMGGMAAQIPIKGDEAANEEAFAKVRADKEREATDGHDGTWVAHPGLVPVAMEVFDRVMPEANQVARQLGDISVSAGELLKACDGPKTLAGLKMNVNVGIGYLAAWLRGQGAVPLHNLMEDAATAEICRSQLWQWRHTATKLDGGETVDSDLIEQAFENELGSLKQQLGEQGFAAGKYAEAAELMKEMVLADKLAEFLTIPAYDKYFVD